MNNKDYFELSIANPDFFFNNANTQGKLVVSTTPKAPPTKLMVANHKLIELICTYKTITENELSDEKTVQNIVDRIITLIEHTPLINYTAFCTYFHVIDYPYNTYKRETAKMSVEQKRTVMRQILSLYIENRHNLYSLHGYSDQTLQINSDNASSRRKGKTGITALEKILKPLGFKKACNIFELKSYDLCYILPDKDGKAIFNEFIKNNNIKFEFRNSRDNKNPDMLIKINNDVFITEHKLTNGVGGSQNAEINEIIHFIKYSETKKNIHYISCLQGNYFKKLNAKISQDPKARQQTQNIYSALKACPQNYFLNGYGFEKLVKDFMNN